MEKKFMTVKNARTYLVVEEASGRCLGGVGSNFYRPWVYPLYTPSGTTVIREFPFDHPFHNGFFIGQNPVIVDQREANYWAMPPIRSHDDAIFRKVGRMATDDEPSIEMNHRGGSFAFESIWLDPEEEPMIREVRTADIYSTGDATVCDVTSQKFADYGPVEYPQTKYGAIGIRVEPRLLPAMGGVVLGDGGRQGNAEVVHEKDSDYVAYENELPGPGRFGVFMTIPGEARGPWFIRDYGMALHNPTWLRSISTPEGGSWSVSLRVVAYDGALTEDRAGRWTGYPLREVKT